MYFCGWLETYSSNTLEKNKKRYAYLVVGNLGNFTTNARGGIVVLMHIAWAAIVTSASMVSYDLQVKSVAYGCTYS